MIKILKDIFQDCNINFLIGAGLSAPYLKILSNLENLLTELDKSSLQEADKKIIRTSLYKKYFNDVISKNIDVLNNNTNANTVISQYHTFLKLMNSLLLLRKSTLLHKEVNIFTTNIDIFLEKALEDLGLEYNDGFNGRFHPAFSTSNFKKLHSKKSSYYDNTAEIPVFNLLKLHGSITWLLNKEGDIEFSHDLKNVKEIKNKSIPRDQVLDIPENATITSLQKAIGKKIVGTSMEKFMKSYEKLLIVNPTKEKFKYTLLNQNYYELLRIYSNELEKENSVLFVMGFSFTDEHIREMTLRSANSNPTLKIYIIAHSSESGKKIKDGFGSYKIKNSNIEFILPDKEQSKGAPSKDKFKYDFSLINREIFSKLLMEIDETELKQIENK